MLTIIDIGKVLKASPWFVLVFFPVFVVLLRWSAFYHSVIDWDESLYLLVADRWLDGYPPYTAIWDNKPPGIYVLFAIALKLFGRSVISIRILACIAIIITCYLLYLIGSTVNPQGKEIGLIAGIFYAAISTTSGGMSSNTEIFCVPFSVLAFYFLLAKLKDFERYQVKTYATIFLIGLLLGIGFEIKQIILFDLIAMLIILGGFVLIGSQLNRQWLVFAKAVVLLLAGFVLPFLFATLYFFVTKDFHNYWYATFTANTLRIMDQPVSSNIILKLIKKFPSIYSIVILSLCSFPLLFNFLWIKKLKEKWLILSIIIWFFSSLLGICFVFERLYSHYFLQLSPAVSLAGAYLITRQFPGNTKTVIHKKYSFFSIITTIILINCLIISDVYSGAEEIFFHHVKGIKYWQDTSAQVSEYLRERIDKDSYIYVVDYQPIIYFLTEAKIPTRYAFPSFLVSNPDLSKITNITGIKPLEELKKIINKKPIYIIMRRFQEDDTIANNQSFYRKLNQRLNRAYRLEVSIDSVNLYRLRNEGAKDSLL